MHTALSILVQLLAMPLPPTIKRIVFRLLLGWQIGPGVRIGLSLILSERVDLGAYARIGHFNLIRQLRELVIGNNTIIGNFNDVLAGDHPDWPASLHIGSHSHITSRHFWIVRAELSSATEAWSVVAAPNSGRITTMAVFSSIDRS